MKSVYYDGWPKEKVPLQRSKSYDMLEPNERVEFFDIMVALIRKVLAGQVKTVYLDKEFPGHPVSVIFVSRDVN